MLSMKVLKFSSNLYRVIFGFFAHLVSRKTSKVKNVQPTIFTGKGQFILGENIVFGVIKSPNFFFNYNYIECRSCCSSLLIEDNVVINNNCCIIVDKANVKIRKNTIIGSNFELLTSDFHPLNKGAPINSGDVSIGENVFIGNNVTILKSVNIGDNSIVAASSVVTKSFPSDVIIAGNPARVIRTL